MSAARTPHQRAQAARLAATLLTERIDAAMIHPIGSYESLAAWAYVERTAAMIQREADALRRSDES